MPASDTALRCSFLMANPPELEQEAELLALVAQGHRIRAAARRTGIAPATAWSIVKRHSDESGQLTITAHNDAVSVLAGEVQIQMLEDMLARMEQDPDYAWKHGMTINAMRGTAIDKINAGKAQPSTAIQVNVLLGDTLEQFTARLNRIAPSVYRNAQPDSANGEYRTSDSSSNTEYRVLPATSAEGETGDGL